MQLQQLNWALSLMCKHNRAFEALVFSKGGRRYVADSSEQPIHSCRRLDETSSKPSVPQPTLINK